jgi:hypothetical protein
MRLRRGSLRRTLGRLWGRRGGRSLPRRHAFAPRRALVSEVVRHRERRGMVSHFALREQSTSLNVWTLCDDYGEEDYEAMDDDVHRNAAYTRAFASISPCATRWLEIGCGASATCARPTRTAISARATPAA